MNAPTPAPAPAVVEEEVVAAAPLVQRPTTMTMGTRPEWAPRTAAGLSWRSDSSSVRGRPRMLGGMRSVTDDVPGPTLCWGAVVVHKCTKQPV